MLIFNIQKFSVHDGPGIRTTVFCKGCNLRCQWCHNPESYKTDKEIILNPDKCIFCGKCVEVCSHGARFFDGDTIKYDDEKCVNCYECCKACVTGALSVVGREIETQELYNEIIKDKAFYDESGGGVTFSGGECMLQADALAEILKLCKENGLHTIIDTAGHVAWKEFEKVLPYTDMFLYDLKIIDDAMHKNYTGVSNKLIIENFNRIEKTDIIVRVPLIKGINDDDENIYGIIELVKNKSNVKKVELMHYHNLGLGKQNRLINCPEQIEFEKADTERIAQIKEILKKK